MKTKQNSEIYFVKKKSGTYISLANKHKMFANPQNITHVSLPPTGETLTFHSLRNIPLIALSMCEWLFTS